MKKFLLGILLAAVILGVLFSRVDLHRIGRALLGVNPSLLALALVVKLAVMGVKARRWAWAIREATGVWPLRRVFAACMVGFAGNVLMPARLGELARAVVLSRHNGLSKSLCLTSAGITQLFDLLVLGVYCLAVSFWAVGGAVVDRRLVAALLAVIAAVAGGLVLFQWKYRWLRGTLWPTRARRPTWLWDRLGRLADSFSLAVGVTRRPRALAILLADTLVIWLLETGAMFAALEAFGIPATPLTAALLVVVLNLSFAVPLTPGNVGTHQLLSVLILGSLGVSEAAGLAFSVGLQGSVSIMIVLIGMAFLYREGIGLGLLRELAVSSSGPLEPDKVEVAHHERSVS